MNQNNKKIEEIIRTLSNLVVSSKFDLAIIKSKKAIRDFPEYVVLYNILGLSYQNIGKFGFAKEILNRGLKMDPNNISIMNNLATTYKNLGEFESAENLFLKVIEKKPEYINSYINYGNLKRDLNDFEGSLKLYNKALSISKEIPIIFYSISLAHQGLGNFKQAIDYANEVLLLDPKFTQADMLISQSTKYLANNEHYKEMEKKIKDPDLSLNDEQKCLLYFALAKANEDMGNIDTSFNYLKLGNKIKRQSINFNIKDEIELFDNIKTITQKINFNTLNTEKDNKKNIIFILGMPRSGTTLVEQIISSHTNVFGAGELPYLTQIIQAELMIENTLSIQSFHNLMNNESLIQNLRDKYYSYLNKFSSKELFITDKAPLNFRWIWLIKILFPSAKIIHCSRNPKDNCLSLYKNLFEGGLNFSYDQKELGTFYNLYSDLMLYWKKIMPTNSIFEAKYEKIIDYQVQESKKIIEFCGLDWDDKCLSFHKNKTPIKTMSTAQAREPIYRSSLNSYEKFSPFLETLNKII